MVNLTLYIFLLKEKERLSALEKRYQSLTGGKTFSKPASMKEVRAFNSHDLYKSVIGLFLVGKQTTFFTLSW